MNLQEILQQPNVWRGRDHDFHNARFESLEGLSTGHEILDAELPEGGWPRGALTEILSDYPGQGELQLLIPSLRKITREQQYVALINPTWTPYAPALKAAGVDLSYVISIGPLEKDDQLWALEQVLRSGHCSAVLAWPGRDLSIKALRRLQLAAEAGQSTGFLFRSSQMRRQNSPAALRVLVKPPRELEIIKCRGRYFSGPVELNSLYFQA